MNSENCETASAPLEETKQDLAMAVDTCDYEVESVLDCRWSKTQGCLIYLIKWKDYDATYNSWERESNLEGCKEMVSTFHQANAAKGLWKRSLFFTRSKRKIAALDFPIDDEIDAEFIGDFGQNLTNKRWQVEKISKGQYLLKRREQCANALGMPLQRKMRLNSASSISSMKEDPKKRAIAELCAGKADAQLNLQGWIANVNEISAAAGEAPLTAENDVDDASLSCDEFVYVTNLKAGNGVDLLTEPLVGCECTTSGHACRAKGVKCCASQMNAEFAYTAQGTVRVEAGRPIYECNSKCTCGDDCVNRVVQKGRQIPLVIFKTNDARGWGVKAASIIKKHTFISEYVGEVITSEEADERPDASYMFNMDYVGAPKYVIDAKYYGNVSRFINHSCEPNLLVYGVWIDHYEATLPRLAFFTARTIGVGEELTFNYMRGNNHHADISTMSDDSEEEKSPHKRSGRRRAPCRCRATGCRGYKFTVSD